MKHFVIYPLFLLIVLFSAKLSAQVMETKGFIPNKGQYGSDMNGEKILGKFCGLSLDLWLTEEGVNIVYWQLGTLWDRCNDRTDNIGIQRIRIAGSSKINVQNLIYTDSSNEVFHYYLAHCPEGIRDVHSFKKIIIPNILEGVDWEISADNEQGFVQRFVSSSGSSAGNIDIIQSVEENQQTLRKDTFDFNKSYPLVQERAYRLSQGQEKARIASVDSVVFDWATYWGGGRSNYSFLYQSEVNEPFNMLPKFSFSSLNSSCTDKDGNLYTVGKSKLSAFRYYQHKDSVSIQDSSGIDSEAYISRFDAEGKLLWMIYYGSSQFDEATTIAINAKNEIYVGGGIDLSWKSYVRASEFCKKKIFHPKLWENDFPLPYRNNAPSFPDTGSCFFLKFNIGGERLGGFLFGPECSDRTDMKTFPLKMCFSPTGELYVTGLHTSTTYLNLPKLDNQWGKNISVFGPDGSDVYSYDDLKLNGEYNPNYQNLPFILKVDTTDKVIWSTYAKVSKLRDMQVDKNGNLYIYGDTFMEDYPQTTNKKSKSRKKTDQGDILSSWAYLAEFNPQGKQIWCTHIKVKDDTSSLLPTAMDISPQGHIFLTGSTTSKNFPIVEKEGRFSMQADENSPKENTFLMEFDANHALIWSTLYIDDSNSAGWDILCNPQKEGSFFLVENRIVTPHETWDNVPCFLSMIEHSNYSPKRTQLPLEILPYGTIFYGRFITPLQRLWWRSVYGYMYSFVSPSLHLSFSPYGKLFLTGNATTFSSSAFTQPNTEAYLQRSVVWDTMPITGFILRRDLCDTTVYPSISLGFKDSLFCPSEEISLELYVDGSIYPEHQIVWNAGTETEYIGDTLKINKQGDYFVQARSIYTNCPSVYGDTVHIKDMPIPTKVLPKDTLTVCVSENAIFLSAYNEGCTYLWSDHSTDSVYKVYYRGDSLETIWCKIMNRCYGELLDSAEIRFLPPYAYLGKDSVLCGEDTLLIDATIYNQNIPVDLEYLWILSGDTLQRGIGAEFGAYVIRPGDSGMLCLQVLWLESECKIAKDTIQVSYYPYPDVDFTLIKDTTTCYYDSVRIDLTIKDSSATDQVYKWYRGKNEEGIYLGEGSSQSFSEEGHYTVVGENHCSRLMKTTQIIHYPKAWISPEQLPEDTSMCKGGEALLLNASAQNSTTLYFWKKSGETEETESTQGFRSFSESGDYELRLQDTAGCQNIFNIQIREEDCAPKIEIPNVFTPNGDGVNDYFKVKSVEKTYNFEIFIFNAWGNNVYTYKGKAENLQWDGNIRGRAASNGAYFYIATYKDFLGKAHKRTGSVTILR